LERRQQQHNGVKDERSPPLKRKGSWEKWAFTRKTNNEQANLNGGNSRVLVQNTQCR